MCLGLGYFVDVFDEHMRPLFREVITLMSNTQLKLRFNAQLNSF